MMRGYCWHMSRRSELRVRPPTATAIEDVALAIWRRIRLIPLTVSIPPEEQDRTLCDKLVTKLSGILNWALQGCVRWQREGLDLPLEVKTAIATYRAEMDTLADFFAECCMIEPDATASAREVYTRYTLWCEENGERPERQKAFGMRLSERGFRRVKNQYYYLAWGWHSEMSGRNGTIRTKKPGSSTEKNAGDLRTGKMLQIVPFLPYETELRPPTRSTTLISAM